MDIIRDYCGDLLQEIGIKIDAPSYGRMLAALEKRVNARLMLEILNLMTSEQAQRAKDEIDSEHPDPNLFFALIVKEMPDLGNQLIEILALLRNELLRDFKALSLK